CRRYASAPEARMELRTTCVSTVATSTAFAPSPRVSLPTSGKPTSSTARTAKTTTLRFMPESLRVPGSGDDRCPDAEDQRPRRNGDERRFGHRGIRPACEAVSHQPDDPEVHQRQ